MKTLIILSGLTLGFMLYVATIKVPEIPRQTYLKVKLPKQAHTYRAGELIVDLKHD